jgi:selenocysteine lyase/cysteine desulfurase/uncharacterized protein YcbX
MSNAATVATARASVPPGSVYADWAARALPLLAANSAPNATSSDFSSFLKHPHSSGESSASTAARTALAHFLGDVGETHDVVLVSGATAGLHSVAERLPWSDKDTFVSHTHAHSALLGVRNRAWKGGASCIALDTAEMNNALVEELGVDDDIEASIDDFKAITNDQLRLPFAALAFPGECNLTGAKYPVSRWAKAAHGRDWSRPLVRRHGRSAQCSARPQTVTIVDAAALAASAPITPGELTHVDILVCSLYKLTGYPTGIGALLVRRGSYAAELMMSSASASYFAGGRSVAAVAPRDPSLYIPSACLVDTLEMGTQNLDAIEALPVVLARVNTLLGGMTIVSAQACHVADTFRSALIKALPSGRATVHVDVSADSLALPLPNGPIVSFSIFQHDSDDEDGIRVSTCRRRKPIGHLEVSNILQLHGIYVRSGCMCNPGACAEALGTAGDADSGREYALARHCNDEDADVVNGMHTGVVRASFGWASTEADALRIVDVLRDHWGAQKSISSNMLPGCVTNASQARSHVVGLYVFPVKGCAGVERNVIYSGRQRDESLTGGAAWDRELGIVSIDTGLLFNRQTCPLLDFIHASPAGDLPGANRINLKWVGVRNNTETDTSSFNDSSCVSSTLEYVCRTNDASRHQEPSASNFIELSSVSAVVASKWLGAVSQGEIRGRFVCRVDAQTLANRSGTVHVISLASSHAVADEMSPAWSGLRVARATRANIVVEGVAPWAEDAWVGGRIALGGGAVIEVLRRCGRCPGMNVAGEKGEPLRSVSRARARLGTKRVGRIGEFGVVGRFVEGNGSEVRTGCEFKFLPA